MRFLIVDDDASCRELLKNILSPHADCEFAANGSEAIAMWKSAIDAGQPHDLLLLDIMMPEVDGHGVADFIRDAERAQGTDDSQGTKILMTTALSNEAQSARALMPSCEHYVGKPIDAEGLFFEIRDLLQCDFGPKTAASEQEEGAYQSAPTSHLEAEGTSEQATCEPPQIQEPASRFLIVDDEPSAGALLERILSPHGQCDVVTDGKEALDALQLALSDDAPYDLICLDVMMPGMDGHEALEAIRKLESEFGIDGSDGVNVIMTTALRDSKHCVRAFREGCDSYVTKPISEDDLLAKLEERGLLTECVS